MEVIVKKGPTDKRKGITIIKQKRVKLTREDWRGLDKKKFDDNYDKIKWKGGKNKKREVKPKIKEEPKKEEVKNEKITDTSSSS